MNSLRFALALLALPLVACGGRVDLPSEVDPDAGADVGADVGSCSSSECGPAPGAPSVRCWDGSYAGASCERSPAGTCGWVFRDCPPEKPCTGKAGECGGASFYCLRPTGVCAGAGICAVEPEGCDLLYAPVCGCDGKTYGNACAAGMVGMNVQYEGECKGTGTACNTNADCKAAQYCKRPDGVCGPKPAGTCTSRPSGCPDLYDPVCGCDGKSYSNSCDAAAVGVGVASKGSCPVPPPVKVCGGFGGFTCGATEWCDYADADLCGAADGSGVCKLRPSGCSKELAPVCGCDGKTYGNACLAHAAGQDDRSAGACK